MLAGPTASPADAGKLKAERHDVNTAPRTGRPPVARDRRRTGLADRRPNPLPGRPAGRGYPPGRLLAPVLAHGRRGGVPRRQGAVRLPGRTTLLRDKRLSDH